MGCGASTAQVRVPKELRELKTSKVIMREHEDYKLHRYQYAYSSHGTDGSMSPAAIVYPQHGKDPKNDVAATLLYAAHNKLKVAVRTGGHSYSGNSSTFGDNIILDLSEAFFDFDWNDQTGIMRAGISFKLGDFNRKLTEYGLFLPHGQCIFVHVGGHTSSGGYGQFARGFGLIVDHIVGVECITPDGKQHTLMRNALVAQADKDLFFALFGASPGNIAVITHLHLKPKRDRDHPNSIGFKGVALYDRAVLRQLMQLLADFNADTEKSPNFDIMVSVLSSSQTMMPHMGIENLPDEWMAHNSAHTYGENQLKMWPSGMMVYAQWNNLGGANQKPDDSVRKWFEDIKKACTHPSTGLGPIILPTMDAVSRANSSFHMIDGEQHTPLSRLAANWVFTNTREYQLPYKKRGFWSNRTDLNTNGWVDWITNRIAEAEENPWNGLKICCQVHPYGGKHSKFTTQRSDDVCVSWRADSTMSHTMDCFYDPESVANAVATAAGDVKEGIASAVNAIFGSNWDPQTTKKSEEGAIDWMQGNTACVGKGGLTCDHTRRVMWETEGDLHKDWAFYYDSKEKYDRLCAIKRAVDPNGILTPNAFVVGGGVSFQGTPQDECDRYAADQKHEEKYKALHADR